MEITVNESALQICPSSPAGRAECSYYKTQALFVRYTSKLHVTGC